MIWLGLLLILLAVLALWFSRRLRANSGLPEGRVIYSDTHAWQRNTQSLVSEKHGLTGKPDYLIEHNGAITPVELKSGTAPAHGRPREGHIWQAMAYCLLVHETFGARPKYALIQYADRQFSVDYTPHMEQHLLRILSHMREDLALPANRDGPARSHNQRARCASCGLRESCDQVLT